MCRAGNYLPLGTGLQKWIPLPFAVTSHCTAMCPRSSLITNLNEQYNGIAPPDPTQRVESDCGWNLRLSHILEPKATFLEKKKGGILVKPRTQSRVPSCFHSRIVLTAAMRTRYNVYFRRILTVLGVYSKKKIVIKRKPYLTKIRRARKSHN